MGPRSHGAGRGRRFRRSKQPPRRNTAGSAEADVNQRAWPTCNKTQVPYEPQRHSAAYRNQNLSRGLRGGRGWPEGISAVQVYPFGARRRRCQEISRGLSERQRAQPPVIRSKKRRTPAGCEESLHPYRVRLSLDSLARWYALKNARVPPANFHARLRRGAKSINLRGISAANRANSANTRAIRVIRAIRG